MNEWGWSVYVSRTKDEGPKSPRQRLEYPPLCPLHPTETQ